MKEEHIEQILKQDVHLREAVRRKAKKTTPMPATLNTRLMERLAVAPQRKHLAWPWMAAAACIAAVVLILLFANHKDAPVPNEPLTAQRETGNQPQTQTNEVINSIAAPTLEAVTNNTSTPRKVQKTEKAVEVETMESTDLVNDVEELTQEEYADAEPITPPIQKAAHPTTHDPHALTPDNMDRMIAQVATYYNVEGLELNCSNNDDLKNGTMYVLPDDENIDIIGRLYSTLLHFDTSAPNIQLIYSSEQFLFCLTSERNGKVTEDYWIAERSRGRIYLYRTSSTDDEPFSTACFFNFVAKHDRKHSNYS